jgi:hypothetical protein
MKFIYRAGPLASLMVVAALASGCATKAPPYDYAAFRASKPAALLVLPPINESPDVRATSAVWSQATLPLAEAGYYVFPVALVDETLKQNGIQTAADAQNISHAKLREVFGADAAVYLKVLRYGTSVGETRVEVEGRLVDLKSGQQLWAGKAVASSSEQGQQNQGGLVGLLAAVLVKQILGTVTDSGFIFAGTAQTRLLGAPRYNGILPGPRSPVYGQPMPDR